jgi:hypothetical protein
MRMAHSFKLSHRMTRHRASLLAALMLIGACNSTDSLDQGPAVETPTGTDTPAGPDQAGAEVVPTSVDLAAASRAGIPFGTVDQPVEVFSRYNGALRIISPSYLMANLAAIRAHGGRVMLDMAGAQRYWRDGSGHFSMTKWKARVNRYKGVNFQSYINDGTIIGHYLIDEPNDPTNWSGRPVSGGTVEEMAKYSKQLWPGMPTVVRAEPGYMAKWSGSYRYLDAAWAQYVSWKGSPSSYLSKNVSAAQKKGLALVVGLNITRGNNGSRLSASQIKSWGSAMLNSSYPCAFLSWRYSSQVLSGSIRDAMSGVASQARNRGSKSCRS